MMKKPITILLSLIMIFCLAACGNSADEAESSTDGNVQTESSAGDDVQTSGSDTQAETESADQSESDNVSDTENIGLSETQGSKVLVAYFSATGTTEGVALHIANGLSADIYEIIPEEPYTDADLNYNDNNSRSTIEMNDPAFRPAISGSVENMEQYDIVFIGYPNWWASIPMPIASFLDEYDFSGKTIIPFCSHGGGRFGQSLTAIAKLVPDAKMGEALSVHYSGGNDLPDEITEWLKINGMIE